MREPNSMDTRSRLAGLIVVVGLILSGPATALAGWFYDGRLTYDPAVSSLSFGNARCEAADDSGNLHIVWHDYRSGTSEVYYMRYDGTTWMSGMRLVDGSGGSQDPSIAAGEGGLVHVVWQDGRDGGAEIYYKQFDGNAWGADERLTAATGYSMTPAVAVGGGDRVYVVWYDYRDGSAEIYFKEYDGIGWGADERLTLTGKISIYPSVAVDDSGDVHVAWQDYRDGNYEIYHKWFNGTGWSSDMRVTDAPGSSQQPSIAVDDSGHVHCVWQDSRDGNPEVYYARFNGTGWEADERLTIDAGSSNSPTIAVGSDGTLYVVWSDNRDGNYEVYYKEHDGSQWLQDVRLTTASGASKTPFVETDAAGEVNVVWEDSRDGDREIYWTRSYTGILPAPVVTLVDPDSGYVGETMRGLAISGSGLLFPDSVALQKTGEARLVAHNVEVLSSTQITCDISLLGAAPGTWDCVVMNPDGRTDTLPSALAVATAPKPEIASITPDGSSYGGIVEITDLAGAGFVYPDSVWLEKAGEPRLIAQDVDCVSRNRITCEFDLFDAPEGLLDVVVRNPDGQTDTLVGGFNVIPAPAPEITSINPASGTSGEVVDPAQLTGDNFLDLALVALLKDGEDAIEATDVVVDSPHEVTCRLDLKKAHHGHWDVVLTNRNGKADTMPAGFYVIPLPDPEVYSVTPDSGATGLGLSLSAILGDNFVVGAAIKMVRDGEPDLMPFQTTVSSETHMTCELSLAGVEPGGWDVVVTNPDSGADTLVSGLTVLPGMWGADIRLTYDPGYSITSDNNARCVAVGPEGRVHVVWDDDRGEGREIYYKEYDGAAWGEDVRLTDAEGVDADPAVALDAYGNVHVVWNSNRDGHYNIFYRRFEGGMWTADQQISSGSCGGQFASIAGDDTGAVHVVWEDCRDGNSEIYYRRFDGGTWSAEQRLTSWAGPSRFPSVAADGCNHVHVTWYDAHLGAYQIYYLKSTLPMDWEPAESLTPVSSVMDACVAANTAGQVHVVWWCDGGVYHRMHDGVEWGESHEVSQNGGRGPSVAVDDEGTVHVIWSKNWDIYYRGYDGVAWGDVGKLRAAPGNSEKGSIAVGHDGRVHVVWWDQRDGNREIYYKLGDIDQFSGIVKPVGPAPRLAVRHIVPNPLSGDARVTFVLPSDGDVEMTVFDVRGRLVWRHAQEDLDPGEHSVIWNARDRLGNAVSPGVYFVRLQTGTQTASAKAVVLR